MIKKPRSSSKEVGSFFKIMRMIGFVGGDFLAIFLVWLFNFIDFVLVLISVVTYTLKLRSFK